MYLYIILISIFMGSVFSLDAMYPESLPQHAQELDKLRRQTSEHHRYVIERQFEDSHSVVLRESTIILQQDGQTQPGITNIISKVGTSSSSEALKMKQLEREAYLSRKQVLLKNASAHLGKPQQQ